MGHTLLGNWMPRWYFIVICCRLTYLSWLFYATWILSWSCNGWCNFLIHLNWVNWSSLMKVIITEWRFFSCSNFLCCSWNIRSYRLINSLLNKCCLGWNNNWIWIILLNMKKKLDSGCSRRHCHRNLRHTHHLLRDRTE
jgi:hypothetical protein